MLRNRKPKKSDGERMALASVTVRIDVEGYLMWCEENHNMPEDYDFINWISEFVLVDLPHEIVSEDD